MIDCSLSFQMLFIVLPEHLARIPSYSSFWLWRLQHAICRCSAQVCYCQGGCHLMFLPEAPMSGRQNNFPILATKQQVNISCEKQQTPLPMYRTTFLRSALHSLTHTCVYLPIVAGARAGKCTCSGTWKGKAPQDHPVILLLLGNAQGSCLACPPILMLLPVSTNSY